MATGGIADVSEEDIQFMDRLLLDALKYPAIVRTPPNVFELLGVDDRETRISRVLQFFLDPSEAHCLGDLVIRALSEGLSDEELDEEEAIEIESVEREVALPTGERIDLLVYGSRNVWCIENKLFATLSNDLLAYQNYVERKPGDHNAHFVLLSLGQYDESMIERAIGIDGLRFRPLTYQEFFEHIEKRLGPRAAQADRYYLRILLDFMSTIRALTEEEMEIDKRFLDFAADRSEDIEEFLDRFETLKKLMRDRVSNLRDDVQKAWPDEWTDLNAELYRKANPFRLFDSVIFRKLELGESLSIDLGVRLKPDGWTFRVRSVGENGIDEVRRHISEFLTDDVEYANGGERLLIREKAFDFEDRVSEYTTELLRRLLRPQV